MKHGGKREGAGHPRFSSEFLEWVHKNVANEIQSRTHIWFMARTKSNVGMQKIKDEIVVHSRTDEDSFDSIPQPDGSFENDKVNKELRAEQRLFVAQQWKLGKGWTPNYLTEEGPFWRPACGSNFHSRPSANANSERNECFVSIRCELGSFARLHLRCENC